MKKVQNCFNLFYQMEAKESLRLNYDIQWTSRMRNLLFEKNKSLFRLPSEMNLKKHNCFTIFVQKKINKTILCI